MAIRRGKRGKYGKCITQQEQERDDDEVSAKEGREIKSHLLEYVAAAATTTTQA